MDREINFKEMIKVKEIELREQQLQIQRERLELQKKIFEERQKKATKS